MRKKSIINFFHYLVKYMLIALPIILMLICYVVPNNKDVTINYKYETNEVNSIEDLKVGNIYHVKIDSRDVSSSIMYFRTSAVFIKNTTYLNQAIAEDKSYLTLQVYGNQFRFLQSSTSNVVLTCATQETYYEFEFVYYDDYQIDLLENTIFSKCENIPVDNVFSEGLDTKIYTWLDNFANLPINQFYNQFGAVFGLDNIDTHNPLGFAYYMPLWILYIYIFDLMLDTLCFIPKLAHKWMEKLGGYDD